MASSRRPSVMGHSFSQVPSVKIPRSSFDRSHGVKTTFDAGLLIPILVDEALPGDSFNVNLTAFARLATPIKPIFDNMYMDTHFFAVPLRLVWDNWQRFNGERDNPSDSIDFLVPQFANTAGVAPESLHDYMGVPPSVPDLPFNALYARAYSLVYNEWFRDQNLIDSVPVDKGDAGGLETDYVLRRRGKRHDYFTSALPFTQKGDPVSLPLGVSAPVVSDVSFGGTGRPTFNTSEIVAESQLFTGISDALNVPNVQLGTDQSIPTTQQVMSWVNPSLTADLSTATAATINDIREAFQIQKLLERDARGGTRYTEIIRSHFGVISPDQRLQRPEYLGGGSSPINIHPVAQTNMSASDVQVSDTPQGNLAGFGTVMLDKHGFTKSFTEHCIIIGLASVRADLTYQQGLNRMFSRQTRYDFYWPSLSHIGEQEVLNKEIYAVGSGGTTDDEVFGYQERYAEYRYKPSIITGKFRSSDPQSLDFWHLSQEFESLPLLNQEFIEEDPPVDRVIAVPSEPQFLFDGFFSMRCARPMPLYGVPGFVDHF